jgi:uncharacterized protein YggE
LIIPIRTFVRDCTGYWGKIQGNYFGKDLIAAFVLFQIGKEKTMRSKFLLVITIFAVLALGLSACGSAPTRQENPRTVSVTGSGSVSITPDIAYISIGVHTESPTASEAVDDNNAQTQKVIDSLVKSGVAAEDIRTSNFSIWPNQYYDDMGQSAGTYYSVDNTVNVTIRDLTKMGELLDAAITAGANTIYSISFDLADKSADMAKARDLAVKNAQAQAAELAAAAGVELGEIQSISYYDSGAYPYTDYGYGYGGGGGEGAAMAVPINPGTLNLTASVNISYFIK